MNFINIILQYVNYLCISWVFILAQQILSQGYIPLGSAGSLHSASWFILAAYYHNNNKICPWAPLLTLGSRGLIHPSIHNMHIMWYFQNQQKGILDHQWSQTVHDSTSWYIYQYSSSRVNSKGLLVMQNMTKHPEMQRCLDQPPRHAARPQHAQHRQTAGKWLQESGPQSFEHPSQTTPCPGYRQWPM